MGTNDRGTLALIVSGNFSIQLNLWNFVFYSVAIVRAKLNYAAGIRN